MSRNTLATLATIGIFCAMALTVICGAYFTAWLLFGGIVQMYQSASWLTVEFLKGAARVAISGPAALVFIVMFSLGLQLIDDIGQWAKGRV